MALTIDKMLSLPEFVGCRLVAGAAGRGRLISCVDTMEIPNISPWIREHELLVTTGYSIIGRSDLLMDLLDALYKNNSAGLVIKTRFIGPLPREAIDRANAYGVPIILMPDEQPFIPLLQAVGSYIADEQYQLSLYARSIAKKFKDPQQPGQVFSLVSETLHGFFGCPVVITDFLLAPCGTWPEGTKLPGAGDGEQTQTLLSQLLAAPTLSVIPAGEGGVPCVVQKMLYNGALAGYIFLISPRENSGGVEGEGGVLLEQAAGAVAPRLFDSGVIWNTQQRQQNHMVYRKLTGDEPVEAAVVDQWVSQYGWPRPPLRLVSLDIPREVRITPDTTDFQVMWIVRSLLREDSIPCVAVPHDGRICCVTAAAGRESVARSVSRVLSQVEVALGIRGTAAVSAPFPAYTDLRSAHDEAFQVIRIGQRLGRGVAFAEDYTFELALLRGADRRYLERFVASTLGELMAYDRKNGSHLMATLQELVDHMGVQTQTAAALYMHRNTLLHRIRRIEALTGLDLSNSDDLYRVRNALLVKMLLE